MSKELTPEIKAFLENKIESIKDEISRNERRIEDNVIQIKAKEKIIGDFKKEVEKYYIENEGYKLIILKIEQQLKEAK